MPTDILEKVIDEFRSRYLAELNRLDSEQTVESCNIAVGILRAGLMLENIFCSQLLKEIKNDADNIDNLTTNDNLLDTPNPCTECRGAEDR